jgi:hypothetical protein
MKPTVNPSDVGVAVALASGAVLFWYLCIIVPAHEMVFGASNDPYTQIYPMARLASQWMRSGYIPLWNPFQFCGHPFLASVVYGIFYPLNFPYLLMSTAAAIEAIAALHLFLAGLFTYLYGRTIRLSRVGAMLAAIIFMLSGFVTSQALWFTPAIGSIVWLPVGFIAIERLFEQPRFEWSVLLAVAVAMPILAGWLQTWTYSMHAIGAYLAFRLLIMLLRKGGWPQFPRAAILAVAGLALGLCLAAVQLLPSFELQGLGPRRPGRLTLQQSLSLGPVSPQKLLADTLDSRPGFPRPTYVGILPFFLIPLSVLSRRGRVRVLFMWLLGLWSIAVAMSVYTPVFTLFRMLPGGTWFRVPSRILFLAVFAGAVLSGIGLDVALTKDNGGSRPLPAIVIAAAIGLAGLVLLDMPGLSRLYVVLSIVLVSAAVVAPVGPVRYISLGLVFGLVVCDLFVATRNPALHPFHDLTVYDKEAPAFEYVKEHQDLYRTYVHWSWPGNPPLMPKQGTLRHIYSITDYEGLTLDRDAKFYALLDAHHSSETDPNRFPFIGYLELEPGPLQLRLIDLMSVRYIIDHPIALPFLKQLMAPGSPWRVAFRPNPMHYEVLENPRVLPRAYVAHQSEIVEGGDAALQAVSAASFDPRMTVVLEESEGVGKPAPVRAAVPITPAGFASYAPTEVIIQSDDIDSGYLVLTDTFYPGWKALVDGRPQPVYRANYLFRAVRVPAGHHTITFVYRPRSFQIGAAITVASVAVVGLYGLLRLWLVRARGEQGNGRMKAARVTL